MYGNIVRPLDTFRAHSGPKDYWHVTAPPRVLPLCSASVPPEGSPLVDTGGCLVYLVANAPTALILITVSTWHSSICLLGGSESLPLLIITCIVISTRTRRPASSCAVALAQINISRTAACKQNRGGSMNRCCSQKPARAKQSHVEGTRNAQLTKKHFIAVAIATSLHFVTLSPLVPEGPHVNTAPTHSIARVNGERHPVTTHAGRVSPAIALWSATLPTRVCETGIQPMTGGVAHT